MRLKFDNTPTMPVFVNNQEENKYEIKFDGIFEIDMDTGVSYAVDTAILSFCDINRSDYFDEHFKYFIENLLAEEHREEMKISFTFKNLQQEFRNGCSYIYKEALVIDTNQNKSWYSFSASMVSDPAANKDKIILLIKQIIKDESMITANDAIRYRLDFDPLTGIYNASRFYFTIDEFLVVNPDKNYAMIIFDIEKFKVINDIYGNKKGDKVLKKIARILADICAGKAIYSRLYSDIFAILMPYVGKTDIHEIVDSITQRIQESFENLRLRPVFGIYYIEDRSMQPSLMCDRAMMAKRRLKERKLKKFTNYSLYEESMRDQIIEEQQIEESMVESLEKGYFEMYLQPKYSMRTSKIVGAEALVRWHHPSIGTITPDKFINIFEHNGFITELDALMLDEACKFIKSWMIKGLDPVPISVNLSRYNAYNDMLKTKVLDTIKRYGIDPKYIAIELTESLFVEVEGNLRSTLMELRARGISIQMDDFGSGFSSLASLRSVPVDTIKMDKAFIDEALIDEKGKSIVRHTVAMAKDLKMTVVAEGVETLSQAEFLKSIDCDIVQGFYFAKPMRVFEFEKLLALF